MGAVALAYAAADPLELALPLVRRVRGLTGVQSGPALLASVNAVVLGLVSLRSPHPLGVRTPRGLIAVVAWCALSPLPAAVSRRTVLLRERSPLWAYPLHVLPRALVVLAFLPAARRAGGLRHG
jgi:hypothetical protein